MKRTLVSKIFSLMLVLSILLGLLVLPAQAAEVADSYDGSQLWLNYRTVADSARLSEYRAAATAIVVENYDMNPTYRHSRNGSVWTPQRPANAAEAIPASTLEAARLELSRALRGLTGNEVPYADSVSADGAVVVGTPDSSPLIASLNLGDALSQVGDEGYVIRSVTLNGKAATAIAGNTELGALYGTYAFIRLMQTQKTVRDLSISDKPRVNHRRLNNWDAERLYAGTNATGEGSSTGGDGSIFEFSDRSNNRLPLILDRYIIFARMCASVGINEITINNVNAREAYLSEDYIKMEAALADVLRPYGVRIGLSVRYTSATNSACNTSADTAAGGPSQISGNDANNPYVEKFQNWWTKKTEQIRSRIPDFVGYTVKANSEGQPGPQDYGYDHGDGAYGLGQALTKVNDGLPNTMTLFWRTFVYNASVDTDRLKRAYMEFKPINDDPARSFGDNVFVQTKNGPLDFQGREPFHPMFGAMDQTNQAIEVQLTQEYTGHHVSLCYLGTEWEEIYKSDTRTGGKTVLVGEVLDGSAQGQVDTAIVGVNNVGNTPSMTGNHFAASNFFAFGRQAWDWTQSAEDIAEDWVRMTWSNDDEVVATIVKMMMGSYEALVSYQTPYGVGHQMTGTGTHYFPNPGQIIFNGGSIRDDWSPAYYSRVDGVGVGYNRTDHEELTSFGMQMGSNLAGQYAPELAARYNDIDTIPENLLLWFHHVPWEHTMRDGRTFWEDAVYLMQEGVQYVSWMRDAWASLEGKIDAGRFNYVTEKLWRQEIDASEWRDFYRGYWNANNGLDIPVDGGALSVAVTLGTGANQKTFRGFDLSVDEFNKTQPGNLPNSDSRRSRYNAAGGNIADASGAPFSNMFVPVDKTYTLAVPSNVARSVSKVEFLNDGGEGSYEIVSATDSRIVLKVTREGDFGPLVKTYTFNLVADTALSDIQVNGVSIPGFDPEDTEYAVMIDDVAPVVPSVTATAEDPAAEVTVTPALQVPGKTTVTVKNGSATKTYTVSLTGKAGFTEEFDGSALSDEWSWVRETANNWTMAGSALTITAASGDIKGGTNTARNILTRSAGGGDWEATARLSLSAIPSGSNQAAFLVYQDDGNYLKVNVEYASNYLRASGGVERNGSYTELFYDALETRQNLSASKNVVYFRIVKEADTYRLSWGTDDTALRSLGVTAVSLTEPKIGTLATGAGSFRVSYDSITLADRYDLMTESTCTHEYTAAVTAPTCTEFGYTTYTCSKCGASYTDNRVEPLGHDWDEGKVTTPPTDTTSGVRTYTCRRCSETRTERIPRTGSGPVDVDFTNPADADKYEIVGQTQAAPVAGEGLALITTRNAVETCNNQNSGDQANTPEDLITLDVDGDWVATLTVDFNQNGASNGYYQFFGFYAREGEDYQNMAGIRGGNNDMQNFLRVDGAITADTDGVKSAPGFGSNGAYTLRLEKQGTTYICYRTDDGETFTEMFRYEDTGIEADSIVIDAYTGMTTGYKFTLKSLTFEGGGAPAVDYSTLEKIITAAEEVDTDRYTDETVAAMQRALAAAKAARTATTQAVVDSAAQALYDAVAVLVPKHVHEYQSVVTAPTCTETGYTTYTCACGDSYKADEVPALGHSFGDWAVSKAATCTEKGEEARTCARCGEKETREVNALGHDYKTVVTAPTCLDAGYTTYTCARCGDSYRADEKAALGHSFGEWTVTKAATCTEKGEETRACSRCDVKETREIAALGHNYVNGICTRCGAADPDDHPSVIYNALEAAIAEAEGMDAGKWTDASFAALQKALEDARAALKADKQADVDAAAEALNAALKSLVERPPFRFDDVQNEGDYFFRPVYWAVEKNITTGTSPTTFSPSSGCTRAQVVTFLWRAMGQPEPTKTDNPFEDVKESQYYYKAILWAVENGITTGTSPTTFRPDQTCTRGQIVTFLWRYNGQPTPGTARNPFQDVKAGEYYTDAVLWAVSKDITKGTSADRFSPNATCTRAQIVTFLYRSMVTMEPK